MLTRKQGIKLSRHFVSLVESSKELKLVAQPSFSLSVFCVRVPDGIADAVLVQNELTLKLAEQLSTRKDITVTKTVLNGVYCIRFAVGAERTEEKHVDAAFYVITDEARRVLVDFHDVALSKSAPSEITREERTVV